ncbi:MAG TPA: nodulation protein NfeD [bacterium (Candidatus Stahlbacteria)]|nr:nodulation protein NfeD [Candidatus Stahlbacteria bacterium]
MNILLILVLLFNHVDIAQVDGAIGPMTASYTIRAIEKAEQDGAECLVIKFDTPGGLDESMRDIIKKILNAKVPVVIYVHPAGARDASAGVFITLAAHIAAMTPGTNIGAAHPVSIGGEMPDEMKEKAVNDAVAYIKSIAKKRGRNVRWAEDAVRKSASITAEEALKLNVIDVVADDVDDLLSKIDGKEVDVAGTTKILSTKGATTKEIPQTFREKFLSIISSPNIAYILLIIGMYGIIFELSHPGAFIPGVLGAISLILAFFAFRFLPINYAGLALIILAVILFVLEALTPTYGPLAIGGVTSMVLGSLMLIKTSARAFFQISIPLIITVTVLVGGFFTFALAKVFLTRRKKVVTGDKGLIGEIGKALERIAPEGRVFIHGEIWKATSSVPIKKGEKVRVVAVEGLTLRVEKI